MHVLQINSSIYGNDGTSSRLADGIAGRLASTLVRRDLSAEPIPHLDGETFDAFGTDPAERSAEQTRRVAVSDALIDDLRAADVLLLAVPMYNFGIPSGLKAWIDQVARAGVTFRYTPDGPEGLLGGKRVIVVTTRGGEYAGTEADNHAAYLQQVLAFLGLGEPEMIYVEGLARSGQREAALEQADQQVRAIAA